MKKSLTPDQEAVLLEGLVSHSHKAYSALYDHYGRVLLGVINQLVHDPEQSEDLLQETFIKVWQQIHRFDPAKGRLFSWLMKIARNTALDYLRSPPFKRVVEFHWKMGDITLTNESLIGLRDTVLAVLSPHYQPVIEAIYFQGYTHQEVSELMGLPLGTVKTRVRLALVELKHAFGKENKATERTR